MSIDKNNLIKLIFQVKSHRELRIENWELRMKKQSLRDGTIENWEFLAEPSGKAERRIENEKKFYIIPILSGLSGATCQATELLTGFAGTI